MVLRHSSRLVLFSIVVCGAASHTSAQVSGPQGGVQQGRGQQRTGLQQAAPRQAAQQQAAQQQAAQQQAARQTRPAGMPNWIPLDPKHEKYLDEILNYWEHKTSSVKRYRCNFTRNEYEMTRRITPTNQTQWEFVRKTYTEGKIQYEAPDKGLFKAELIKHRTPPAQPGGQPGWQDQVGGPREHWVCDGKSIFEFNHSQKQLIVRPLPPGMQGKQIAEGPLPFMFGAKAAQIKSRFWVHVITPKEAQNEYHLEAVPRTAQDAQNFRMLHIIIDGGDFLPKGMVLFHRNNAKTTFSFNDREVNWNTTLEMLNIWNRDFFEPALPARDWKKVVVPVQNSDTQAALPPPGPSNVGARAVYGPARQAQATGGQPAPR